MWREGPLIRNCDYRAFSLSKRLTKSHNNGFITPISYKQDQYTVNGDRLLIVRVLLTTMSSLVPRVYIRASCLRPSLNNVLSDLAK